MDSVEMLRAFFGWCIVIHVGVLLFAFAMLQLGGDLVRSVHKKLMGLSDEDLSRAYFQYLAQYKIGIWLFAIVPYFALLLIE